MENEQTQEPQPDAGQTPPPPPPVLPVETIPNPDEQPTDSENTQSSQTIQREPTPIIIQDDHRNDANVVEANTIARRANRISWFNFGVAVLVFLFTYLLFRETQIANDTTKAALQHQVTKDSQDAADKAKDDIKRDREHNEEVKREEDKFFQDSVLVAAQIQAFQEQGKRFETSTRIEKERNDLQRATTQAQLDAFKEQNKRFEIEKRPYLHFLLDSLRIDTFKIDKPLTCAIFITNLGQYPAKIVNMVAAVYIDSVEINYIGIEYLMRHEEKSFTYEMGQYITEKSPLAVSAYGRNSMSVEQYQGLVLGTKFIFVSGYVKYKNLLDNKLWVYKFLIKRVYQDQHQRAIFMKDENEIFE